MNGGGAGSVAQMAVGEVAVIAVAKDEAAYLPEWVHHHLHFGFDKLFVALNRTTDTTPEVAAAMAGLPALHVLNVDWLDWVEDPTGPKNRALQLTAYAHMLDLIRREHPGVTHILPIDIDEFWFPADFQTPVRDWLAAFQPFDILSVHWLWQFGEEAAFAPPFAHRAAQPRRHVKSFIHVKSAAPLRYLKCHTPRFHKGAPVVHLDAAGDAFAPHQRQQATREPDATRQRGFILHRALRSKPEYKAMMMRGNADDNERFKANREPFHLGQAAPGDILAPLDTEAYQASWTTFRQTHGLEGLLGKARDDIMAVAGRYPGLGRPWVFENLAAAFGAYRAVAEGPRFGRLIADRYAPLAPDEAAALTAFLPMIEDTHPGVAETLRQALAATAP